MQSKQAKSSSRTARKVDEEKIAVENSAGDGLHVQENAATSWDQAAGECRAKVAAIVDECKRLNQKYRDPVFDLEATPYCLQSLSGRFPKAVDRIVSIETSLLQFLKIVTTNIVVIGCSAMDQESRRHL